MLHHVGEFLEEIVRVVRSGIGFRVVLDAEGQFTVDAQALAHSVVEVDVGHLDGVAGNVPEHGRHVGTGRDGLVDKSFVYQNLKLYILHAFVIYAKS